MRTICICLLLLGPVLSVAQDAKDPKKVTCRFLCLEGSTPPPPLINITDKSPDKGAEVTCTVPTNGLSPAIFCDAKGDTLNFIFSTDRTPAATVRIPPKGNAFILVFVAAAKAANTLPWRVFVIEDTPKNFPDGGAFVANFHNQDIRFLIGTSKLMLHPEGFHGFARPDPRDAFNMAPVVFEFQQQDTWRTASESMLRFLPGMRYLIFAYVDAASGRPSISTYQDFRPFSKPPEAR
jgi:hypothetical protein